MITPRALELWGGLAAMFVGGLVLAALILAAGAGAAYRLFMLTSGRARLYRSRLEEHRLAPYRVAEHVDGAAATVPLPVVSEWARP